MRSTSRSLVTKRIDPGAATKDRIVAAADRLFYEHGFEHTSFAQIADAVGISRGNFYHHFTSKDAILSAVIDLRTTKVTQMLSDWETSIPTARDRVHRFVTMWLDNSAELVAHGCPVGTLCVETNKLGHPANRQSRQLLTLLHDFLYRQFLPHMTPTQAGRRALDLLARSQGVALVANALGDRTIIVDAVRDMHAWVDSLVGFSKEDRPASAAT